MCSTRHAKNTPKKFNFCCCEKVSIPTFRDAFYFVFALPLFPIFLFLLTCSMTRSERYRFVIEYFQKNAPEADTELIYDSPYELLVSVILSAQCTDKRVNMTTPALFEKYPDISTLSNADPGELFTLIKSISYPNNKTK